MRLVGFRVGSVISLVLAFLLSCDRGGMGVEKDFVRADGLRMGKVGSGFAVPFAVVVVVGVMVAVLSGGFWVDVFNFTASGLKSPNNLEPCFGSCFVFESVAVRASGASGAVGSGGLSCETEASSEDRVSGEDAEGDGPARSKGSIDPPGTGTGKAVGRDC